MLDMLIVIAANIFRIYAVFRFMRVFFDKEVLLKKEFLTYVIYFFLTTGAYWLCHSLILDIIINVIGLYIITCVYSKRNSKRIFVSILVYLINMACDTIVFVSFTNYSVGDDINEFFGVLTSVFIFLVELIAKRIIKIKCELDIPTHSWIALLCVPTISALMIFILVFFFLDVSLKPLVTLLVYGILLNNIVVFYLYNSVIKFYKIHFDNDVLKKQVYSYANQLKLIKDSQDKYNSLKHDLKHHVRILKDMVSKQQDSDSIIQEYLYNMEKNYQIEKSYVNSGNAEIDSILNYMLQKAHELLNAVNVKVKIPSDVKYNIFDLNVILGNLLENAIFAAEKSKEKWIDILIYVDKGVFHATIKNTYNGEVSYNNGKFITTKSNSIEHGIGLENVNKIVGKYNGALNIEYTDLIFQVDLMLYLIYNRE